MYIDLRIFNHFMRVYYFILSIYSSLFHSKRNILRSNKYKKYLFISLQFLTQSVPFSSQSISLTLNSFSISHHPNILTLLFPETIRKGTDCLCNLYLQPICEIIHICFIILFLKSSTAFCIHYA